MISIMKIEYLVYPPHMRQMQGIQNMDDLHDYCESDNVEVILFGEYGYALLAEEEVVDLASTKPLSLPDMMKLMSAMKKFYGNKKFSVDAREGTSYRLLLACLKRGKIKFHSDEVWDWEGETMHSMVISFKGGKNGK